MSLLQKLIKEEAAEGAVSAGDVAGVREPLGSEPTEKVKVKKKKKKKKTSLLRRTIAEMEQKFDQADVISKLKAAEKSAIIDQDTVAFGLEDEEGNMVKVHVRAEQAEDFQAALETALAGNEDDETEDASSLEIAEVLFELKDKFEIVDIDWGAIPEDEEENQEVEGEGDELGLGDEEGDMGDEDLGDEEMVADEDLGDEEVAATALTQVIDMMKADAEAKKAEAEAKKAEADAKTAGYAAQAAAEKVKQEEEILDMETYNKSKADADKEAKRLAQLAKYKHDMAGEADVEVTKTETEIDVAPEEEEDTNTLSVDDLTDLLRKRLQSN